MSAVEKVMMAEEAVSQIQGQLSAVESVLESAEEIAVECFSLSKSYNMPGWRVGFMCGNKTLIGALARIKSYLDYGMFTPIQVAAIAALRDQLAQLVCVVPAQFLSP